MTRAIKPILDSGLYESIENTLVQFSNRGLWKQWGMNTLREQGAALLFYGPSGTGKTTAARWIAKSLGLELRIIDYGDIGSDKPGQLARNIKYHFSAAIPQGDSGANACMLLLDECDTMLVDRRKLAYNSIWMLEPINQLLVCIRQYKGLVVLATNAAVDYLDPALDSRLLAKFHFTNPMEELTRVNLWKSKWPARLPVQPDDRFLDIASKYDYNGAQIEGFLIQWVGDAIRHSGNEDPGEHLKISKLIDMLIQTEPIQGISEENVKILYGNQ